MKKIFSFAIVLITSIVVAQTNEVDYVVKNVNVVPMNSNLVLKNQDVKIKDGKIIEISKSKKSKNKTVKIIDGKGMYLMPSLSDAHVHFPETEKEMEKVMQLNIINGITKLRSMRGDWNHVKWREKYNAETSYYPKLYISAPPISRQYDLTIEQMNDFVKSAKDYNFDFIKILSIKSETLFKQLDSVCKSQNISLAGHFLDNPKGIHISDEAFFNSNYKSFEHLGGLIGEPEKFDSRIKYIQDKKMVVCPTLLWYDIGSGQYDTDYLINQDGMQFVKEETKKEWVEKTNLYREKTGKAALEVEIESEKKSMEERFSVVKKLNDLGIDLIISPDASSKYMISGFALFEEMKLYKKSGLSNYDILKSSTLNFAKLFNENYGTIEIGKNADFILLGENPLEKLETLKEIKGVFYNNFYLNESQLNEIRNNIEK
ncbi:amidohydrolase family protein [Flavobacterium gelidilacus]|uniref:amidohydrolase family protein n=1 Tax=Flavobacterium gelidilacus TaxID=206041 RepID=UPI0004203354|nr:amidohydrolase family protein [Flavobacterium gelidilacus]